MWLDGGGGGGGASVGFGVALETLGTGVEGWEMGCELIEGRLTSMLVGGCVEERRSLTV